MRIVFNREELSIVGRRGNDLIYEVAPNPFGIVYIVAASDDANPTIELDTIYLFREEVLPIVVSDEGRFCSPHVAMFSNTWRELLNPARVCEGLARVGLKPRVILKKDEVELIFSKPVDELEYFRILGDVYRFADETIVILPVDFDLYTSERIVSAISGDEVARREVDALCAMLTLTS